MNRLWMRYFGRGLVETEEDFGTQGSPPSHPELLDWLAGELIRQGWSLKEMHRLIVTSSTYRQSSRFRPDLKDKDPRNLLLAAGGRGAGGSTGVMSATSGSSGGSPGASGAAGATGGASNDGGIRGDDASVDAPGPSPMDAAPDATSQDGALDGRGMTYDGGDIGPVVMPECPGDPTVGWTEYADTFHLEYPYNLMPSDRYTFENGIHTFWVFPTEGQLEVRFPNAPAKDDLVSIKEEDLKKN